MGSPSRNSAFHSLNILGGMSLQQNGREQVHLLTQTFIKMLTTVERPYNGHLGGRRKWALQRDGRCREVETRVNVWTVRPKKWPLWRGGR